MPIDPSLPTQVEATVAAIAEVHARHEREATPMQRVVRTMTASLGRPTAVGVIAACVAAWVAFNLIAGRSAQPPDPPPFVWLQGALTLSSLLVTLLILVTQRRDDVIAAQREQLTLELAILGEQKTAKIIALLEDLRRDHPEITDRVDAEAVAMSKPADTEAVLDAIRASTEPSESASPPG